MAITAQMVKDLREKTGAGMMDCKTALQENNGDLEAAIDWLRAKGVAKAVKKSDRVASEGLVCVAGSGNEAVVVEVNSETDFVARNEQFQALVSAIAEAALSTDGSLEAVKAADCGGKPVEQAVSDAIATIGENMTLRRSAKIGVLVGLKSTGDAEKLTALGRQIAMHVAAANPLALDVDSLDQATVERERAVFAEQARDSGKPENIIEKMVEGRMRKFYEESVLLKQVFVIDGERSIEKVLADAEGDVGAPVALADYVCFKLGEGVEREEAPDFAAEVAAAVSQS
jgi:elongation factor Ts